MWLITFKKLKLDICTDSTDLAPASIMSLAHLIASKAHLCLRCTPPFPHPHLSL